MIMIMIMIMIIIIILIIFLKFKNTKYIPCVSTVCICTGPYPDQSPRGTTKEGRKEGNVLLNDALNTFYLRLYGVRHMVNDYSDSERGNPLPPHGLLFPISSKGSFISIIPQT